MYPQKYTPSESEIVPAHMRGYRPDDAMRKELQEAPLTQEMYEAIKGYWQRKRSAHSWRNVLLIMLMRNTGFRPAEIVRPQSGSPRQHIEGGEAAIRAGQLSQRGPVYWVDVKRAKKREEPDFEPVILNPELGQPLMEYVRLNNLKRMDYLFDVNTRQLANIWYEACEAILTFKKEPTCLRDMYVTTVAQVAHEVLGYTALDVAIASKMVGHSEIKTTRHFYEKLTFDQKRAIQERIPV